MRVAARIGSLLILLLIASPIFLVVLWPPNLNAIAVIFASSPYVFTVILCTAILLLGLVIGFVKEDMNEGTTQTIETIVILTFMILLFAGIMSIASEYNVNQVLANELNVVSASLPEIDIDTIRILPRGVATTYIKHSLQYPRYDIAPIGIYYNSSGKTLSWQFAITPSGVFNLFLLGEKGYVNVLATTTDKKVQVIEKDRKIGIAPLPFDIAYHLPLRHGFFYKYEFGDMFYIYDKQSNHVYAIIPVTKFEWKTVFPLMIKGIPKPTGVVIVDEQGRSRFLTFGEAMSNPLIHGNPLIAENVARFYIDILNWKRGLVNLLFFHKEQFEVADTSEANKQPFFMVTNNGSIWFFAVKPYGRDGIYKFFYLKADDPNITIYQVEFDSETALLGPHAATEYVKKEMPNLDWDIMATSEPLPIILNGTLYWNVRIVPIDYTGVSFIALVNAATGDVTILKNENELVKLISGSMYEEGGEKETTTVILNGTLLDLKTYVVNGNTRFVLTIETENRTISLIAHAEELSEKEIIKILTLEPDSKISLVYDERKHIISIDGGE